MLQFEAGQLQSVILDLIEKQFSGAAYIEVSLGEDLEKRSRVLVFHQGQVAYGGWILPSPKQLAQMVGRKFKLTVMDAAIQLASKKVKDRNSVREYFSLFVQLELFKWPDIKSLFHENIILVLEQVLPFAGTLRTEANVPIDFRIGDDPKGFEWEKLMIDVTQRGLGWKGLQASIPSMNAVPHSLLKGDENISDAWVRTHIQDWINGQHCLVDIATQIERDPLELAHTYLHWVKMGWIDFEKTDICEVANTNPSEQPTILSVDDSPVVQTMIKRAISDRYNVLLANNAVAALGILNSQEVSLLLLDVTMPDIDGLELCRTIRNISKFKDLPVIMLTAKEGMINKLRGQIAGSTHYLTKPVNREKLLDVIEKYLNTGATNHFKLQM